jgi:type II secretion system protein L
MGFTSTVAPPLELRLLLAQSAWRPAVIEVEGDCDAGAWSEALGVSVELAQPPAQAPPVALDLLQYGFSRSLVSWRPWRTTIVLGAILLFAAVAGLNLQAWTWRAQEKALQENMVAILKESFPQVSAVLDPVVQMQRLTSDMRTGAGTERGGFLSMTVALGQLLEADSLQSIEYRDGRGTVRFRSQIADTEAKRELLSERTAKAGLLLRFAGESATLTRKEIP